MTTNDGSAMVPMASFLDGSIVPFDGEDKTYSSTKWAQDIEDNADVFGWSAQQKLIIARRSLCGTAALWLRSEKVFKTYEELKTALQKEFPEACNTKEMHELMASRKKTKDESFLQYMLSMKELGKRAKFPDYVAIQYIVDGIQDSPTNKLILYGVTTYSVLKDKLAIYEKMKAETKETRSDVGSSRKSYSPRRCYNCGEKTHESSRCPNGLKCFRCNKYGHIGSSCPTSASTSANSREGSSTKSERNVSVKQSGTTAPGIGRRNVMSIKQQCADVRASTETSSSANHGSGHNDGHDSDEVSNTDGYVSPDVLNVNKDVNKRKYDGKPIKTIILDGKYDSEALIDSGSDVNLISTELYAKMCHPECNVDDGLTLTGLGRSRVQSLGKITMKIMIDGQCYDGVSFYVINRDFMHYDVIIGQEFLKNVMMLMSDGCVNVFKDESDWLSNVNSFTGVSDSLVEHVKDPVVKQEANKCIDTYHPVQVKEAPLELKIVLKDDVPVTHRPRRLSYVEQGVVERQIDEWLKDGIIQVSHSEYCSPLVLVKKKDGSTRVGVDYRKLNSKIAKNEYPLPIIDDLIYLFIYLNRLANNYYTNS